MRADKTLEISELFKILSDPTRIQILKMLLSEREMCVNDIAKSINMSHSATSHQLSGLTKRGIVVCERKGKTMCYKINKNSKSDFIRKLISLF